MNADKGTLSAGLFGRLNLFDRRVWLLAAAMLVFRFGQGLYYPFSAVYFHNILGIPLSLVGVGFGVVAATSVLSGLVSGPLSDRWGRKPVMLLALAGSAATFAGFAFVSGFWSYLALSAAAGLLGAAPFDAARNATIADVTPESLRARAYGLVRVGANVGWALGPIAAGAVAATVGGSAWAYGAMFAGAGALTFAVFVLLALFARESLPKQANAAGEGTVPVSKVRAALSDGRFVLLLGVGFLLYYVFTQNWQALPVYAKNFLEISDWRIGLFLAGNGVAVVLFQLPVAYLLDGRSKIAALAICSALFAASSATLLLTDSFWGILLAFAGFFTLAETILEVAGPSLAAALAPVERRGTYLSLFGCCYGASYGISPIVAGALLDLRLPAAVWTVQLLAAGLALAGLVALKRSTGKEDGKS